MGGWPFLIARGRRVGYRVLLAPEVLDEYGFLEDAAGPAATGVRTAQFGRYGLAWTEHPVADVVDEHSRPLRLTVGMLYSEWPHPVDLDHARAAALDTYGRFLADEEGFRIERSPEFGAHVHPAVSQPPPRRVPHAVLAGAVGVALVAVAAVAFAIAGTENETTPPPPCPSTAPPTRTPSTTLTAPGQPGPTSGRTSPSGPISGRTSPSGPISGQASPTSPAPTTVSTTTPVAPPAPAPAPATTSCVP